MNNVIYFRSLKKIIIFFIYINLFLFFTNNINLYATSEVIEKQADMLNIESFLSASEENTSEIFKDLNYTDIFNNLVTGNTSINNIFFFFFRFFSNECKIIFKTIITIFIVVIIHSIFKAICENLGNESVGKIAYFVQYIVIVILIMNTYSEMVIYIKDTISKLVDYTYVLIPILMTLLISTGNVTTVSTIEPIILFTVTFIGKLITNFLIPILLLSNVFSIISNISKEINIEKLSKFLKSSTIWILGFSLTIFSAILSVKSFITKNVDEVTIKATKNIVSTAVPVVGKVLSDTTETLLSCASLIKNSVGIIGIIVIIGICLMPLIKIFIYMIRLLYSWNFL